MTLKELYELKGYDVSDLSLEERDLEVTIIPNRIPKLYRKDNNMCIPIIIEKDNGI